MPGYKFKDVVADSKTKESAESVSTVVNKESNNYKPKEVLEYKKEKKAA